MSKKSSEESSTKSSATATEEQPTAQSHEADVEKAVKDVIDEKVSGTEIKVNSAEMWEPATRVIAQHKIVRADGSVLVFDIRGIPSSVYYKILKDTMPMDVPEVEVPQLDKRGKPVVGLAPTVVKNDRDPSYLTNIEEMRQMRTVLIIDASLTFDIPGNDWKAKSQWLQERLPGDVDELYLAIDRLCYNRLATQFKEYL